MPHDYFEAPRAAAALASGLILIAGAAAYVIKGDSTGESHDACQAACTSIPAFGNGATPHVSG